MLRQELAAWIQSGDFFFFGSLWSSLWQAGSFIEHTDSLVIALRLSCSLGCGILVPQPGIEPMSPIARWILNHWTTREALGAGI